MERNPEFDPYEVLGAVREATTDGIRRLYRDLAKRHHPDAGGDREQWDRLTLAHDILIDPDRRAFFDTTGRIDAPNPYQERQEAFGAIASMIEGFTADYVRSGFSRSTDPRRFPVMEKVRRLLDHEINEAERAQRAGTNHLKFMQDYAGRFKRIKSAEGVDPVAATLRQKIAAIEDQLRNIEHVLRVRRLALELVEEYSFEHEEEGLFATTATTTATTTWG